MGWGQRFDALVLGGASAVVGVYLTDLPILLGSKNQVLAVVLGFILGAFAFAALSTTLLRRVGVWVSAALGAVVVVGDALYVGNLPLVGRAGLAALFALACAPILPVGAIVGGGRRRGVRSDLGVGLWLAGGALIFFFVSLIIYEERGFSGLPYIASALGALGLLYTCVRAGLAWHKSTGAAGSGVGFASKRFAERAGGGGGGGGVGGGVGVRGLKRAMRGSPLRVAAASLIVFLVVLASPAVQAAASQPPTRTPIQHVVFIMMENHSFDNLFGVYPTDNSSQPQGLAAQLEVPVNLIGTRAPAGLKAVPPGTYSTPDPVEGYIAYHRDWAGGSMDGFAANSGPQSMSYYTSAQMAVEWDLAEQYALADMYFASTLSETSPNRLYSLAGYSPVVNDYGPPPYVPFSQSIFAELSAYGVSWAYYVEDPSDGVATLSYFAGISKYSAHIQSWADFLAELGNGSLPAVSWVMPIDGGAQGYSQGPPSSVLVGELWLLYIVDAVEKSPEWPTTAIFITYDEGGGYYDQVAPPTLDGQQLGQRVPLIVVSPYAKEDYVSHTILTHTSLLAFVDYNWRLPALNGLVQHSNIPLDMFDFNQSYPEGYLARPPIDFAALGFPVPQTIYSSSYSQPENLSRLYPMAPQIALGELPYVRSGSANITLAQIGGGLYAATDSEYTPAYTTRPAVAAMLVAALALLYVAKKLSGAQTAR